MPHDLHTANYVTSQHLMELCSLLLAAVLTKDSTLTLHSEISDPYTSTSADTADLVVYIRILLFYVNASKIWKLGKRAVYNM